MAVPLKTVQSKHIERKKMCKTTGKNKGNITKKKKEEDLSNT